MLVILIFMLLVNFSSAVLIPVPPQPPISVEPGREGSSKNVAKLPSVNIDESKSSILKLRENAAEKHQKGEGSDMVKDTSPKVTQLKDPKTVESDEVKSSINKIDISPNMQPPVLINNSTRISVLPKSGKSDIVESGALLRGFYVFLGLSVLMIIYFAYRSYWLRRGSLPTNMVRKYGVTARRSDIEMRPLELDEEDDETIFEIGTKNSS